MAQQITEQVQNYAKLRIEHLLVAHDLAVGEVGGAHRAAAGLREAKIEQKHRLEEQKVVAKQRGLVAMCSMLNDQKEKVGKLIKSKLTF